MKYRYAVLYGMKAFDCPAHLLPERPFLSLPVRSLED